MRGGIAAIIACAALLFLPCSPALANETTTYSYDALGRLVGVASSGTVNNGQAVSVSFDAAGNRTNYTMTGAGGSGGTPSVSIGNASVTEGGTLAFPVTLSASSASAVTVQFATANGTASAGSDYTAVSGTLTIPAGQTGGTINVVTIDDTLVESSETLTVTLSAPSGATLGTATGTGTIIDNDTAPANLAIGNASATEGGNLVFTVTRTGNTASAVSVNYASASGTATSGSDFTATSGTLSFAANQTTATITVPTIDDTLVESTETMSMTLSGASSGATITAATGTGSIIDNDVAGWTASLTSGTWQFCYFSCSAPITGYLSGLAGSMSNTTYSGYTITGVYNSSGSVIFYLSDPAGVVTPANSGWSTIAVPGVGTLSRANATYSTGTGYATWTWPSSSSVASGTVTIQ